MPFAVGRAVLFNTVEFFIFFAAVLLLYRALPHRGQNWMLLVASYVFYGWWDWRFLALIGASTLLDWALAAALSYRRSCTERSDKSRRIRV